VTHKECWDPYTPGSHRLWFHAHRANAKWQKKKRREETKLRKQTFNRGQFRKIQAMWFSCQETKKQPWLENQGNQEKWINPQKITLFSQSLYSLLWQRKTLRQIYKL